VTTAVTTDGRVARSEQPGGVPPPADRGRTAGWREYAAAGPVYLALSLVLWWRVWTTHPSSVMTCGCVDAGREAWYFEWTAYALAHGHNPWYSQWVLVPKGVNVLADTSVPLLSFVMTPVTLIFGPIASMNTVSLLTPVLAALAMFWLLRRWVRWTPAAFVGGLAYGFSSFIVVQLAFGWLNIGFVALVPLMVGCLDELLIGQRRRPPVVGAALGLLVALQFFVGVEILLLSVIVSVIGIALLAAYAAKHDPADLRRRLAPAARGLGAAVVVAGVLLVGPVLFFLYGPAHLGTVVWAGSVPGNLGNAPANFWSNVTTWGPINAKALADEMHAIGGYQGPPLPSGAFLGWGLLAVLVGGMVVWRRDRRLWFWGSLGVIIALLSLRAVAGEWGPWALIDHLPLLPNVWQSRLSAFVDLCAAAMLAIVVDHTWAAVRRAGTAGSDAASKVGATVAAIAVAAVALVPVWSGMAPNVPVTVQTVALPQWFARVAPHLPPDQVLLTYPTAAYNSQTPIVWQAVDRMSFRLEGGGGPGATAARAGVERAGFEVLNAASVKLKPAPAITPGHLEAVRRAVRAWGVTMVVVPDQGELPVYLQGRSDAYAVAFFTAVLGAAPRHVHHAWVWDRVGADPGPAPVTGTGFAACTGDGTSGSEAARCVLAGARVAG
jgi:hypothetical protein